MAMLEEPNINPNSKVFLSCFIVFLFDILFSLSCDMYAVDD
jgi:hypothetical protein